MCFSEVRILQELLRVLSAEAPRAGRNRHRAQRSRKEGNGTEAGGRSGHGWGGRGRNMGNASRMLANCQLLFLSYFIVIRTAGADSSRTGGSRGIGRSWRGSEWFDTAVEMCGKGSEESSWCMAGRSHLITKFEPAGEVLVAVAHLRCSGIGCAVNPTLRVGLSCDAPTALEDLKPTGSSGGAFMK